MTATESTQLFETISRLRDDGTAVVLISHRLAEVMTLADRVTVLRDGSVVWTGPTREISPSKAIGLMVGRSEAALQELRPTTSPGEVRLSCLGLTRRGEFDDIDFEVRAGEVHGMAGLVGAGRSELAACLFGASRPDAGSIDIDGHDVSFRAPIDAIRAGIALVPEDRRLQGIFPGLSVLRNGAAATDALGRDDTGAVRDALRRLRVKAPSLDASIATLSGGNQQKVVLARWLALDPRILILDEPTRGVDVGTKLEIYELIGELVGRGTAVLLISSDIEELMALTTRITVMRRGRIVARLGSGASANDVVSAAFGHAE